MEWATILLSSTESRGIVGTAIVALAIIVGKLIELLGRKSGLAAVDRRRADPAEQMKHMRSLQGDVDDLREALRRMNQEHHYLYGAISRSVLEFPETADYWKREMAEIDRILQKRSPA